MPKTELPHIGAQTEEVLLKASIQIAEKIIKGLEETELNMFGGY